MNRTLLSIALFFTALNPARSQTLLEGKWLGILERSDGKEIPFNFDTTTHNQRTRIHDSNGSERL